MIHGYKVDERLLTIAQDVQLTVWLALALGLALQDVANPLIWVAVSAGIGCALSGAVRYWVIVRWGTRYSVRRWEDLP